MRLKCACSVCLPAFFLFCCACSCVHLHVCTWACLWRWMSPSGCSTGTVYLILKDLGSQVKLVGPWASGILLLHPQCWDYKACYHSQLVCLFYEVLEIEFRSLLLYGKHSVDTAQPSWDVIVPKSQSLTHSCRYTLLDTHIHNKQHCKARKFFLIGSFDGKVRTTGRRKEKFKHFPWRQEEVAPT